jgi:hypothetical protein
MSTSLKTFTIIAVVVVIGVVIWVVTQTSAPQVPQNSMNNGAATASNMVVDTNAPAAASVQSAVASRDASDTSLNQDMSALNGQINAVASEGAAVDQNLPTN